MAESLLNVALRVVEPDIVQKIFVRWLGSTIAWGDSRSLLDQVKFCLHD